MKIMLLTETLAPGGAETFVVRLANAMSELHEVSLVVMHSEQVHPAVREKLAESVALRVIKLAGKPFLWKLSSALRKLGIAWSPVHYFVRGRLQALVEQEAPNLIHSHLFHADHLASEVARSSRRSLAHVITVHGDYAPYFRGDADPQILRFDPQAERIMKHASAIVGVARDHLQFFEERFPSAADKLHLIYNGYSTATRNRRPATREELGLPEGKFLFGMISRGVEKKGWAQAVAAFQALGRKDAMLVLVGEGPAIERIRRESRSEGVIFTGFSANPLEIIRHFDVCLLPTFFPDESLPTAIMEYLFCAKPVIATDVGEIRTMLTDPAGNLAGLLLDLHDGAIQADELASKMALLLDDGELRSRLSGSAAQAFEKFDMARCIKCYSKLYHAVVKEAEAR